MLKEVMVFLLYNATLLNILLSGLPLEPVSRLSPHDIVFVTLIDSCFPAPRVAMA